MTKIERGSFSQGSNTTATIVLSDSSLVIQEVSFFVRSAGSSDTVNHTSDGFMTATQQQALSTFTDSTGSKSSVSNTKCIAHNARVGGVITEVITANRPANPFATAGQFNITFTANSASYTIYFIARGN